MRLQSRRATNRASGPPLLHVIIAALVAIIATAAWAALLYLFG